MDSSTHAPTQEPTVVRVRDKPQLPSFSGEQGDLESWLTMASYLLTSVPDKERIVFVVSSFTSKALQLWSTFGPTAVEATAMSWNALCTALRKVFGSAIHKDELLRKLQSVKFSPTLGMQAFLASFAAASADAPSGTLSEEEKIMAFIMAFDDYPAFQDVLRLEHATKGIRSLRDLGDVAKMRQSLVRVATTSAASTTARVAAHDSDDVNDGAHAGFFAVRRQGKAKPPLWKGKACFICGSTGHLMRECPERDVRDRDRDVGGRKVNKRRYLDSRDAVVVTRVQAIGPTQELCGLFGDKMARCLIDSGSQVNLISHLFATRMGWRLEAAATPTVLEFADGRRVQARWQHTPNTLVIGELETTLGTTLVTPMTEGIDIILGEKWLQSVNPNIDWWTGRVTAIEPETGATRVLRAAVRKVKASAPGSQASPQAPLAAALSATQPATSTTSATATQAAPRPATTHLPSSSDQGTNRADTDAGPAEAVDMKVVDAKRFERILRKPHTIKVTASVLWEKLDVEDPADSGPTTSQGAQNAELKALLEEFKDVQTPDGKLPPERPGLAHKIKLVDDNITPPASPPYRLSWAASAALKKILEEMLEAGLIVPSDSPYAAPVLMVEKKDGSFRFCVDFRKLNQVTVRDRFPLPHIQDLLDKLRGASVFTKLDLKSGFWQQRLEEADEEKTAFITEYGLFQFKILAMGLCNGPSSFQRLMSAVLKPYIGDFVVVYLDDLLIYSKDMSEHLQHVRLVLEALRKHSLFLHVGKCVWAQKSVVFLGHEVGHNTVSMEAAKVEAMAKWPMPVTRRDVQVFLGTANFYRRFVPAFAEIAAPLTDVMGTRGLGEGIPRAGGARVITTDAQRRAFRVLKQKLCSSPVLAMPDPDRDFILTTDASEVAVSGVLEQDHGDGPQPVAYASMKLTGAEKNYPVREKELLAQVTCMEHFRIYLTGRKFVLRTDHQSLASFDKQELASGRLARWAQRLAAFEYSVEYIRGKDNVADGLSRLTEGDGAEPPAQTAAASGPAGPTDDGPAARACATTAVAAEVQWPTPLAEENAQLRKDSYFGPILAVLEGGPTAAAQSVKVQRRAKLFVLVDGALYLRGTHPAKHRRCASTLSREALLKECHDTVVGGHAGQAKMQATLATFAYWPKMSLAVARHCKSCDSCQRNKAAPRTVRGPYEPLPVPPRPWHSVALDFVDLPLTTQGHDCALVFTDHFSGQVHIAPTTRAATAETAAELTLDFVVRTHGLPTVLTSDRDARFTSAVWQQLWQRMGSTLRMTTAHRPQADGKSERSIRSVQTTLRHFCNSLGSDWDTPHLRALVELGLNSSVQQSTGKSALEIVLGYAPTLPASASTQPVAPPAEHGTVPDGEDAGASGEAAAVAASTAAAERFTRQVSEAWAQVRDALRDNQEKVADRVEAARPQSLAPSFKVGDEVLLHTRNYPHLRRSKIHAPYVGPFKVTALPSAGTATLALPKSWKLHPTINVDQLKRYVRREETASTTRPGPLAGTKDVFEVEKLLDVRTRHGRRQYLTRWKGYGPEDDTWADENDVKHLRDMINELKARQPSQRRQSERKKKRG